MAIGQLGRGPSRLTDAVRLQDVLFTPQGRLTLASGTPVMTSAVSAAGTLYYTPYVGNLCPVWNGSAFVPVTFAEVGQTLSDATKSPSAAVAAAVYDVFGWLDGTTFRATRGPTWSAGATAGSITARGSGAGSTALARVNGILVNAVAVTNGPAAGYGTYLGTIATDASGATVSWSLGSAAAGGGAAKLNVWNMYNRITVTPSVIDSTASHTYTTASFRAFDFSNGNSISLVRGLSDDGAQVGFSTRISMAASGGNGYLGIGLDGVTSIAAGSNEGIAYVTQATWSGNVAAAYAGDPGIGAHTFYAIEQSDGANANTFFGAPYMALTGSFRQ